MGDPRDRERAERRLNQSLPAPGSPPEELDAETAKRLAWYISNHKEIKEELELSSLVVTPMGIEATRKMIAPAMTVKA